MESGTHEELVAVASTYAELFTLQAQDIRVARRLDRSFLLFTPYPA